MGYTTISREASRLSYCDIMFFRLLDADLATPPCCPLSPHPPNPVSDVSRRCFNEGLFEAARLLFAHIPNWGRLASTLVRLHRFQEAVDAARKANSSKTWKEVGFGVGVYGAAGVAPNWVLRSGRGLAVQHALWIPDKLPWWCTCTPANNKRAVRRCALRVLRRESSSWHSCVG